MGKRMKVEIKQTNLDVEGAYRLTHASDTVQAKKFIGVPFQVKGYAKTLNTITDEVSGEVETMDCLTILTTDNVKVGTNSKAVIPHFEELIEVFGDKIFSMKLILTQGEGKNGIYTSIELAE